MEIDIWMIALALPALMAATWIASRWWYMRKVRAAQHRLLSLDGMHQSTLKLMAQARKQIEDQQRVVSEYRRRLTTAELAARRAPHAAKQAPTADAEELATAPRRPPVVWADTQPL